MDRRGDGLGLHSITYVDGRNFCYRPITPQRNELPAHGAFHLPGSALLLDRGKPVLTHLGEGGSLTLLRGQLLFALFLLRVYALARMVSSSRALARAMARGMVVASPTNLRDGARRFHRV